MNNYGHGSEHDDAEIYNKAWIYRQENEELQNLNIHHDTVKDQRHPGRKARNA